MHGYRWTILVVAALSILGLFGANIAQAEETNSVNYSASEMQFGVSQEPSSCSGSYCAKISIGDLSTDGTPRVSSASFGSIPSDSEPLLEVIVDSGVSHLGDLSPEKTSTKTMIVRIRTYLSDGYTLQVTGEPPKYGEHSLDTHSRPTPSKPGVEQFGINLVANTSPKVGSLPQQLPANQIEYGVVGVNYAEPNLFMYRSGDIVASSSSESGRTDYTISMIVNIANSTPAGHYSGDYSAVVVPAF